MMRSFHALFAVLVCATATTVLAQLSLPVTFQKSKLKRWVREFDDFAQSIAIMDDIDGNGYNDYLVGAPNRESNNQTNVGQAYIIFTDEKGKVDDEFYMTENAMTNMGWLTGMTIDLSFNDHYGYAVCNVGDIDGDGYPEFAVSGVEDGVSPGFVSVNFLERPLGHIALDSVITSGLGGLAAGFLTGGVTGKVDSFYFGRSMVGLGKVDTADDFPELAVGMLGGVMILHLNLQGETGSYEYIWSDDVTGLWEESFSVSLAASEDLDSNGINELLVGAPDVDDGKIFLLFLTDAGIVDSSQTLVPTGVQALFGIAMVGVGDFNGDGLEDFYVTGQSTVDNLDFELNFLSLNSDGTQNSNTVITLHEHIEPNYASIYDIPSVYPFALGTSIAVGDYDSDGVPELYLGDPKGYGGSGYDRVCGAMHIVPLAEDLINNLLCQNDGVIVNLGCDCTGTGFTGPWCNIPIDDCLSSPCDNGANCTDLVLDYMCDCLNGTLGKNCSEQFDACASGPCQLGGTCTDLYGWDFECDCTGTGGEGELCDEDADDCVSSPCFNGGNCTDMGLFMYECACEEGWKGAMCDTDVNDCKPDPCMNGATCTDTGLNSFICDCVSGYVGDTCESDADDCVSSPCFNGATCVDTGVNMYTCVCADGFTGANCDEINDPCNSGPCFNGGSCTSDGADSYTCDCDSAWTGLMCDEACTCENAGVCVEDGCECADGYGGATCAFETIWYAADFVCDAWLLEDPTLDCNDAEDLRSYYEVLLLATYGGEAEDYDIVCVPKPPFAYCEVDWTNPDGQFASEGSWQADVTNRLTNYLLTGEYTSSVHDAAPALTSLSFITHMIIFTFVVIIY